MFEYLFLEPIIDDIVDEVKLKMKQIETQYTMLEFNPTNVYSLTAECDRLIQYIESQGMSIDWFNCKVETSHGSVSVYTYSTGKYRIVHRWGTS